MELLVFGSNTMDQFRTALVFEMNGQSGAISYVDDFTVFANMISYSPKYKAIVYTPTRGGIDGDRNYATVENGQLVNVGYISVIHSYETGKTTYRCFGQDVTEEEFDSYAAERIAVSEQPMPGASSSASQESGKETAATTEEDSHTVLENYPFYGIWCASDRNRSGAEENAAMLKEHGWNPKVIATDEWDNLNDGWYAVTAGIYESEEDAAGALPYVQEVYPDAYIKYTGNRK